MKQNVNYIAHHRAVNERLFELDLNTTHIALYNALFLMWNLSGFETDLSISRKEMMEASKIGSANTYLKCLNDLHKHKIIIYNPSHNPFKGSIVNLCRFDTSIKSEQVVNKYNTSSEQAVNNNRRKNDTSIATLSKQEKLLNNKTKDEILTFDEFWKKYPTKAARQKCKGKFDKLSIEQRQKIKDTIDAFVSHKPFESYTHPNPLTYLNQARWEDEIPTKTDKPKREPIDYRSSVDFYPTNPYLKVHGN